MTSVAMILSLVGAEAGIPSGLLSALCYVESTHQAKTVVKDDGNSPSYGLCQVKLATAQFVGFTGKASALLDAKINATYAAKYLVYQYRRYGSWTRAIVAYNRGSSTGLKTNAYWRKVMHAWIELDGHYGSAKTRRDRPGHGSGKVRVPRQASRGH